MPKVAATRRAPPPLAHVLIANGGIAAVAAAQQAILHARLETSTASRYEAVYRAYVAYCARLKQPSSPMTMMLMNAYVQYKCCTVGNAVSAGKWRTQLRGAVKYFRRGEPEFTRTELEQMKAFDISLTKLYGSVSSKGPGLTGDDLRAIHARLNPHPRKDLAQWVTWFHVVLAYTTLMRPNEHVAGSKRVPLVKDVAFVDAIGQTPSGLDLSLYDTKGLLRVGAEGPEHVYAQAGGDYPGDPLDAVLLTKQYISLFNLEGDPSHPLFCRVVAGRLQRASITDDEYNRDLRDLQMAAGRTVICTSRATRAGRRTDLLNGGRDREKVNQLGRWKSDKGGDPYYRVGRPLIRWATPPT